MTICVGVAVHDCLVFAADSASTLVQTDTKTGKSFVVNVYRHGNKVFNLHKKLPLAAMTAGMGNIGTDSISTLAKNLRHRFSNNDAAWKLDAAKYTVQEVAEKARKYLFEELFAALNPAPAAPHSLEFWIGGYGADMTKGHEVWKIEIVNGTCEAPIEMATQGGTGIFLGGQTQPAHRLVTGTDPDISSHLTTLGMDAVAAASLERALRANMEVQLLAPTMPVQDAIDLADFLAETTKRFFRFLPGADVVGGDTDIAVVTRYEGFKWVKRKHYYPANLNPMETGHA